MVGIFVFDDEKFENHDQHCLELVDKTKKGIIPVDNGSYLPLERRKYPFGIWSKP